MFLSNAAIRRPIAMSCLIIGLALLGLRALTEMGLELLPKMDAPMITVTTVYPGASPEQIETDVAKRIEDQVVSLDGLKHVNSTCMENVCLTFLEFTTQTDVDIAAIDVREKIDLVRGDFPQDVEDPVVAKFDVNAVPVVRLALSGRWMSPSRNARRVRSSARETNSRRHSGNACSSTSVFAVIQ